MKIIYKAFDGQEFCEQHECMEYEESKASMVREYANLIKDFCAMVETCDDSCPFYNIDCDCCQLEENPSNW